MGRVGVTVFCQIDADGILTPLSIEWKDGRVWEIERVLHTCRSPDFSFSGIRYTVLIGGAEKYLHLDDTCWYVNTPA